ncbi:hypothetical protein PTKIN_Ptkin10aG0069300 [Pterospermum kingtungense]
MVKKILRTLPKRFDVKVATIEEAKNTNTMTLTSLVGSLKAYELNQNARKKDKSVAFKMDKGSATVAESATERNNLAASECSSLEESVILLAKKFDKFGKEACLIDRNKKS